MNKYLPYDDFVPFAPDGLGEEVNKHHCKQGKDNDRLYIKRNSDGTIVAYCHHCGLRGFHRGTDGKSLQRLVGLIGQSSGTVEDTTERFTYPVDTEFNFNKWPEEARNWPLQYGLTEEEICDVASMGWSEFYGRVILPVFNEDGELVAWQGRRIPGLTDKSKYEIGWNKTKQKGDRSPTKYNTKAKEGVTKSERLCPIRYCGVGSSYSSPSTTLCIVEDTLSALKVSRLMDSLPLNGSSCKLRDLMHLKKYDTIIIYLDNDNNQVKSSQVRLKRALELMANNVYLIKEDRDPKELSDKELSTLFTNYDYN